MNLSFKNFLLNNSVFIYIVFGLLAVGIPWKIQQRNVDILDGKIQEINLELKSARLDGLERLKLKKDILVIEKDKTIILNGIGATLVQAFGAVVLGATAYVGYQNFKVGADNLKINEEGLRVSKEQQVTERFSKAIEHLGSDTIDIRLGGIYALEQIAHTAVPGRMQQSYATISQAEQQLLIPHSTRNRYNSSTYHWTIVEILSAFVREKCSIDKLGSDLEAQSGPNGPIPENTIKKVQVDIQAALTVLGRRKLGQDPEGKRIDLRKINASQVELQGSKLNGADLRDAHLREANFNGADLRNTNFSDTDLRGADLRNTDLSGANLMGADLRGAYLRDANLSHVTLSNANLRDAHLSHAKLIGTHLFGADLRGADLSCAILNDTILMNVDLRSTDLRGADLRNSNLIGIKLDSINNSTPREIDFALIDENTKLPDYLKPPIES